MLCMRLLTDTDKYQPNWIVISLKLEVFYHYSSKFTCIRYILLHLVYFTKKGLINLWSVTDHVHTVAFSFNALYMYPHDFFLWFFVFYTVHSSTVYRGKYFNKKVPIKKKLSGRFRYLKNNTSSNLDNR